MHKVVVIERKATVKKPLSFLLVSSVLFGETDQTITQPPLETPKIQWFEPATFDHRGTAHSKGEFLYWKIANDGMPYAFTGEPDPIGALALNEKVKNVEL